jgi:hypothetical protein
MTISAPLSPGPSRTLNAALWLAQALLSVAFLASEFLKLTSSAAQLATKLPWFMVLAFVFHLTRGEAVMGVPSLVLWPGAAAVYRSCRGAETGVDWRVQAALTTALSSTQRRGGSQHPF